MFMSTGSSGLSAMAEDPASSVCSLHAQESVVVDIASDVEQDPFGWRYITRQTLLVVLLIKYCDDNLSLL